MEFVDYYAIMGVSPDAAEDELRQSYRWAARRFHPDVNKSPGAALIFREINAAYEVLADRQRRAEYDVIWQDQAGGMPGLAVEMFYSRRRVKPLAEPQLLYVLVKIQPRLEMSMSTSAPLNLCLVVDRSTSMKGPRLQQVKVAAQRIIDECKPEDIISIVSFSDYAEVIIPAQHVTDPRNMKALLGTIRADGATAILAGLRSAMGQIERNRDTRYVNHIVLITDGRTYGDEKECLALAAQAREHGIGISGMGIGDDWNDAFLDKLASTTGGASAYISSVEAVTRFLQGRIRSLATAYAERSRIIMAPSVGVELESVVRIAPDAMKLDIDPQPIPLGTLDGLAGVKIMLQFHLHTEGAELGEFYVGRIDVGGEVLGSRHRSERILQDLTVELTDGNVDEDPPPELLDALSRLTLYRLQDRAREALEAGDVAEATRKLEALATRLFECGEEQLGQAALYEARRVALTQKFSEEGAKQLNYGTRALMPTLGDKE